MFLLELCSAVLSPGSPTHDTLEHRTGVYLGISGSLRGVDGGASVSQVRSDISSVYLGTARSMAIASGRISFSLGLVGPCLPVDTACSASLVAIHLGTGALNLGECSRACASGEGVLEETLYHAFSAAGMLSQFGRCHTFDARADGYCRSEAGAAYTMHVDLPQSAMSLSDVAV